MKQPEQAREKLISVLTLSRKANRLTIGFDAVKETMRNQTARLVLLSDDASPNTCKETEFLCRTHQMTLHTLPFKTDELWYLLGRRAAVLAVTDKGFAEKISSLLETV